jgi:hypothetical protein
LKNTIYCALTILKPTTQSKMTSLNSPSRLKLGNTGFEPQVCFPVYDIDVCEAEIPQKEQRIAGFLRDLKQFDIPYQGE